MGGVGEDGGEGGLSRADECCRSRRTPMCTSECMFTGNWPQIGNDDFDPFYLNAKCYI